MPRFVGLISVSVASPKAAPTTVTPARQSESFASMQPPLDIFAQEGFRQFGPVRFEEPPQSFDEHGIEVRRPTVSHQLLCLLGQPIRNLSFDGGRHLSPRV